MIESLTFMGCRTETSCVEKYNYEDVARFIVTYQIKMTDRQIVNLEREVMLTFGRARLEGTELEVSYKEEAYEFNNAFVAWLEQCITRGAKR